MSVQGLWRHSAMTESDSMPTSCSAKRAASLPSIASPAPLTVAATAMTLIDWDGNDEMEEAHGHGWAELQSDGSLQGEICTYNGDDIPLTARRPTSSTAC